MKSSDSSQPAGSESKITSGSDELTDQPEAIPDKSTTDRQSVTNGTESASWIKRLFRRRGNGNTIRDNLEDALLSNGDETDGFSDEEKTMLTNILDLQASRVGDLMVPRAEINAVEINITLGELLKAFEECAHSRMPVFDDTLDDPRGMVHIRDVMALITRSAKLSQAELAKRKTSPTANLDLKKVSLSKSLSSLKLVRPVLFVPPSMMALDVMERMQANRIHVALVIDEYGGTDGLVSMEDIMEVIVGDIEDEHDTDDDEMIREIEGGAFVCSAKAELDDIEAAMGRSFGAGEIAEEIDTVGGLVFMLAGRIPVRGEVIEGLGFEFRIIDADPRRIKTVEFSPAKRKRIRQV